MALLKDHHDLQLIPNDSEGTEVEKCLHYCEASCITAVEAGLYFIDVTAQELNPHYLERLGASLEICKYGPDFLEAEDVEMYRQIIGICADVCQNCADTCLQLNPYDPFLQECAELCRQYAQRCIEQNDRLQQRLTAWVPQYFWVGSYA